MYRPTTEELEVQNCMHRKAAAQHLVAIDEINLRVHHLETTLSAVLRVRFSKHALPKLVVIHVIRERIIFITHCLTQ
jgi:hypothetical protein